MGEGQILLKEKRKIELPKTIDPSKLTLEDVKEIIEKNAPKRKQPKEKRLKIIFLLYCRRKEILQPLKNEFRLP
ncbi:MAG: hypothetical protein MH219_03670 [Marinobacter sp.]|nr:hypothetical protein [Marinobacter sp.]